MSVEGFEVILEGGERARALRYVQGVLELVCPLAFAPGQPVQLQLLGREHPLPLIGKAAGSKRRPDGTFDVRLRLHSVRREAREQLEASFGKS